MPVHVPCPFFVDFFAVSCKTATPNDQIIGSFLVLRKALLGSYCFVVWVLFLVFYFSCFTSLRDRNTKKLPNYRFREERGYTTINFPFSICTGKPSLRMLLANSPTLNEFKKLEQLKIKYLKWREPFFLSVVFFGVAAVVA